MDRDGDLSAGIQGASPFDGWAARAHHPERRRMATPVSVWTPERRQRAKEVRLSVGGSAAETCRVLSEEFGFEVSHGSLTGMMTRHFPTWREDALRGVSVEAASVSVPPSPELTTEELVADRIRRFERKQKHEEARRLIPVALKTNQPIGILHFGDPHLDDDGTDIRTVQEHLRIVRETPGMYGANVGDTTNNWIGRLAKLYGAQATSAPEAWRLAEWFIEEAKGRWLYLVGGNHDLWSGAGDPLKWISAQAAALYQDSEVRVALRFPNDREVRVNCRHDFAGHSMWNPAHGPMKAGMMGTRDHVLIAGHKHISAYGLLKDPDTGTLLHSILVAGYKVYDRYARERGFRDQRISPSCVTVIDPRLPSDHPGLVKVFWAPEEGADFLAWLRRKAAA